MTTVEIIGVVFMFVITMGLVFTVGIALLKDDLAVSRKQRRDETARRLTPREFEATVVESERRARG